MKTKFIAHRGLSSIAPENSISAFKLALESDYFYAIEADLHVTKDNEFVIFHDYTLPRMTNEEGFIKDYTISQLKKIKLSSGNNVLKYDNENIPQLKSLLELVISYDKILVLEIKEVNTNKNLDEIINILKRYNCLERTIIISFNIDYLLYIRKISNIKIQYLLNELKDTTIKLCSKNDFGIDIYYKNLTEEHINNILNNNITLNVWTVDDLEMTNKLISYNVDFITTNTKVFK